MHTNAEMCTSFMWIHMFNSLGYIHTFHSPENDHMATCRMQELLENVTFILSDNALGCKAGFCLFVLFDGMEKIDIRWNLVVSSLSSYLLT